MSDDSKLHIDEDWKSQVEREKEQLRQQQANPATDSTAADTTQTGDSNPVSSDQARPPEQLPPPPATLSLLIATLATQAMAAMGQIPDESGQTPAANMTYARHFIDMLALLETKTSGNRSEAETSELNNALHHLRMLFVAQTKAAGASKQP